MTTVGSTCAAVRRLLSQGVNDQLVFTGASYTPGQGFIDLTGDLKKVGAGTILSYREQTFYVKQQTVDTGTGQTIDGRFDVFPAYDGGTDIALVGNNAMRVNPRFTDLTLFEEIARVIATLNSPAHGLYGIVSEQVVGLRPDQTYPITTPGVYKVLRVRSADNDLDEWWVNKHWTVSYAPGNEHVRVYQDALRHEFVYATRFTVPTAFDDDLATDCGLSESMFDIPVYGAAASIMSGQEARRGQQLAQADPRRSEDVPITTAINSGRDMYRLYMNRVDEERARLLQQAPYGFKVV